MRDIMSCRSFCLIILLISTMKEIAGDEELTAEDVINKLHPSIPQIEYYSALQTRLEDIVDEAQFYQSSERSRFKFLINTLNNPEVKHIIKKCRKFHKPIICNNHRYRSYDGSCNNLKHPEWGKAITEQRRLLPANYEGTKGFRKCVSGRKLPAARDISLKFGKQSNPSDIVSALFTFFGQFLTHDLMLTPVMTENGNILNCCKIEHRRRSPICFDAIDYPKDDPFFTPLNLTCQNFIKATPYPKCNFGKRGIINKKTSFIDASNVYDSAYEDSTRLRTNDGTGKLRSQETDFGMLMPANTNNKAKFCLFNLPSECFEGGDDRINQHIMLTSLQTIFIRLHNNIASNLHQLNPQWDEETLFQESRRLLIAIYQQIVYKEYLPYLIGPVLMERYNLYVNKRSLYNDKVDPSCIAEFTVAAFRVHSMIPESFSSHRPHMKFRETFALFRPLHEGHLDPLLAGSCEVPSEQNDAFQVDDISQFTYRLRPKSNHGTDLTSRDVQRGRDAGIPTYVDMVKMCSHGHIRVNDFWDLHHYNRMTRKSVFELQDMYEDVRDVDMMMGLYREIAVEGGVVGPTSATIIAIQFYNLKFGDSFFATHTNGRYPFTDDQLEELEGWSLARLLCATTRLTLIRLSPLTLPSYRNPMIPCSSFPAMNFVAWKKLY